MQVLDKPLSIIGKPSSPRTLSHLVARSIPASPASTIPADPQDVKLAESNEEAFAGIRSGGKFEINC